MSVPQRCSRKRARTPGEGSKNNMEAAKKTSQRDWIAQEKWGETPNCGLRMCKVGTRAALEIRMATMLTHRKENDGKLTGVQAELDNVSVISGCLS